MPRDPDPKREFYLHAYVVAGHARTGGNWSKHLARLEALMERLPKDDPKTPMAISAARRFIRDASEDPIHHGENLAAAVRAYVTDPEAAVQQHAWQTRADLQ